MSDLTPVDRRAETEVVETPDYKARTSVVRDIGAERAQTLDRVTQVIWLLIGTLEFLLGLRAVLKLVAANPANPFASFIYGITDLFLWPFMGLTVTPAANGMVLEVPTLIAMAVYALLAWIMIRLIWVLFDRPASRSIHRYEKYD